MVGQAGLEVRIAARSERAGESADLSASVMPTFTFDPEEYASSYEAHGYVHIRGGLSPELLRWALDDLRRKVGDLDQALREFEFLGKKRQFLFDFPERGDFPEGVYRAVAAVTGLPLADLTLCERHVKVYDANALANPPPHKDRLASEVAVGIPLIVRDDSYLVLYPDQEREINPLNTTAMWRQSLDEDRLPERVLQGVEPLKIFAAPGDVVMFRGSSIYHERVNARGSVVLYLKFNSLRLDPIGEDPHTGPRRARSLILLDSTSDEALLNLVPEVSPQLWRVSRHYTRLYWKEVIQGYVGEREFNLSETELVLLKLVDGRRTVRRVIEMLGVPQPDIARHLPQIRRLCRLQAIDLVSG